MLEVRAGRDLGVRRGQATAVEGRHAERERDASRMGWGPPRRRERRSVLHDRDVPNRARRHEQRGFGHHLEDVRGAIAVASR